MRLRRVQRWLTRRSTARAFRPAHDVHCAPYRRLEQLGIELGLRQPHDATETVASGNRVETTACVQWPLNGSHARLAARAGGCGGALLRVALR